MSGARRRPGRQRVGIAWATGVGGVPLVAGPGSPGSFTRLVPAWLADLAVKNYAEASRVTWGAAMGLFAAWCADREVFEAAQVTRAVMEAYQRHRPSFAPARRVPMPPGNRPRRAGEARPTIGAPRRAA